MEAVQVTAIEGLQLVEGYLTPAECEELTLHIDSEAWLDDLKRRVQGYGYRHDYGSRHAEGSARLGPLPDWLGPYARRLYDDDYIGKVPDQAVVNEYLPGQGIAPHVDNVTAYGEAVATFSLGSPCVMIFRHVYYDESIPLLLEPGSLLVLKGEARFQWKHGIPAHKTDVFGGVAFDRARRLSVTFRTVHL